MHKLLIRQLRRHFGASDLPPGLQAFLQDVDAAYVQADEDRALLERSLELTSDELVERNAQLKVELEAVRAVEEQLWTFMDNAPALMGVVEIVEDDVRFVVANPPARELFALASGQEGLRELGRREDEVAEWLGHFGAAVGADGPVRAERAWRTARGERWLRSVVVQVGSTSGRPRVQFVMDDVSEQKELELRMATADRLASMGRLAAGVAHEINNPLAHLIASLDLLARDLGASHAARRTGVDELLDDARHSADRVRRIVRDLKSLTRPDEETLEAVEVEEILDSAIKVAGHELRHRAEVVREYGPTPRLWCNAARLGQLFLNLLVNAAQAIPVGASRANRVTVRLRSPDPQSIQVEIEDTGAGIAAEHLPQLFEPFFTTKGVGEGTGIGLAICQRIVSDLDGEIRVTSAPGRGSTFTVDLPVLSVPERPAAVVKPAVAAPPARRARILVVDDEPLMGRSLARLLPEHHVVVTTRAMDALGLLERDTFDVLVCDVMMPEMTGLELCEELTRRGHPLGGSAILMTGGRFGVTGPQKTAHRCLEKPFPMERLREMVHRALLTA